MDHKAHQCTHIGDLPLQVCTHDKRVVRFLLRNVRCVPTFSDSLISVRQLWLDEGIDTRFGNACEFISSQGYRYPFVPANRNLFLWRVAVGSRRSLPPQRPSQATPYREHSPSSEQPVAEINRSMFIHSSKSISHISALHPDAAARHLHRRLHAGIKRLQQLPKITADAPDNLTRARHASSSKALLQMLSN